MDSTEELLCFLFVDSGISIAPSLRVASSEILSGSWSPSNLEGFLNRFNSRIPYLVLLAMMSVFCALKVSGQDATGRVVGIVYDQSGGVIGDAHVTVTNVATHISRETTSDAT